MLRQILKNRTTKTTSKLNKKIKIKINTENCLETLEICTPPTQVTLYLGLERLQRKMSRAGREGGRGSRVGGRGSREVGR